ncbi:Uncharacterized protein DAT39_002153, partial [Clarias magur]
LGFCVAWIAESFEKAVSAIALALWLKPNNGVQQRIIQREPLSMTIGQLQGYFSFA